MTDTSIVDQAEQSKGTSVFFSMCAGMAIGAVVGLVLHRATTAETSAATGLVSRTLGIKDEMKMASLVGMVGPVAAAALAGGAAAGTIRALDKE